MVNGQARKVKFHCRNGLTVEVSGMATEQIGQGRAPVVKPISAWRAPSTHMIKGFTT
jgi:hypothetical protein